jgi:threonine dehydrogenase-like Zn-dependent dehydrogenase
MMVAYLQGADRVLAIDPNPHRRAFAANRGGFSIAPDSNLVAQVRELTGGRGVDVALEAVGSDAALRYALEIVRPKGTVCAVGAHHSEAMPFPTKMAFNRELSLRFAVGNPISTRDELIPLLEAGRLDPTFIISHRLPLLQAAEGYKLFDAAEATKVVMLPWSGL